MGAVRRQAGGVIRRCQENCLRGGRESFPVFGNGLRPRCVIHSGEGSLRKDRRGGGVVVVVVVVGEEGPAAEMRVAAPFFTGDKNIWRDINLEPPSSLPLLPHHPSSFPANRLPGTPTHPELHSTLLQRPHTHARLNGPQPSVFLPHSWLYMHEATFCNLMQLHTQKHTHTHMQWMQCSKSLRCVAIKCKAVLEAQHPMLVGWLVGRLCGWWGGMGIGRWSEGGLATVAVSPSRLPLAAVGETPPSGCPLIGTFACTPSLISRPSSITHRDQ